MRKYTVEWVYTGPRVVDGRNESKTVKRDAYGDFAVRELISTAAFSPEGDYELVSITSVEVS